MLRKYNPAYISLLTKVSFSRE